MRDANGRPTVRALVVDDEPLARTRVRRFLEAIDDVEVVAEAANGVQALTMIEEHRPDVVILDIQMPGMDGFQMLKELDEMPLVVFATAYNEYAIQAFEINSVDYILKPIERERLEEAVDRVRGLLASETQRADELERLSGLVRSQGPDRLPVLRGKRIVLLDSADVVWAEVENELVFVHTRDERYMMNTTLTDLEKRLDPARFFRIHRSTIVNLDHVVEIIPWFSGKYKVVVDDKERSELVLSRGRARELREFLPW
ncbi:MAG: response regulator [Candidatus Eisenbacteria bacterium]|nr:response regulator [Candidatus Eisenbacteria bacterium]